VEVSARLFGGLLEGFGASEEVKRISESLSKGEIIGAVAMSESEESEPAPGHVTHGIVDGDAYVVTGKKQYVTNAPIADWFAIFGEAQGRPAVFLVQAGQKGVEVGPRLSTLGYNGMVVATLQLSKVRVPKELVLGPFEDRFPMDFVVFVQDLVLTLASVGLMQRTLTAAKDYAERRKRGGRPISRFQEIRFKLAEMLTMFQTAQLLAYRAAWLYGEHDPEARTVLHCAKVFASESAEQVATMAMQIMAGTGYISGNPVERAYRDAKFGGIAGSTSEVARMAIADDLLRRYKV
jgi:alkylation response protein AidB-like acyl-CoA dehydrogenase